MEPDLGKIFIGGISWDTDEEQLKEYFKNYGEVVEAVIMRDRATGRARGFGFVVFADPAVADRVVKDKHMIDSRTVEAKKAVPKEDQHMLNRTGGAHSSPGPGRTRKIFVGGLASTVTENDFKTYFDQFGTVTDVVVMYDHNTQRPRGFGFITYDSEDAVDRVLHKTFHELNGKMVEVKRAVPKEQSPGPLRSPQIGYNYSPGRANNLLNSYAQGYNMSLVGGFGVGMDNRFNPISSGRSGFSPIGTNRYGMGMNLEPGLSSSYGGNSNFGNSLGYALMLSPTYNGNSNRYTNPIGYNAGNGRTTSLVNSPTRNVWGNSGINNAMNPGSTAAYLSSANGGFGISGSTLGPSSFSTQGRGTLSGFTSPSNYRNGGNSYGFEGAGYGRINGTGISPTSSFPTSTAGYEGSYGDFYHSGSVHGDSTWRSTTPELDGSSTFSYGLGDIAPGATASNSQDYSQDYIGSYSVTSRQPNRGIAT
ncbi:putative DAZ-associated protein 1, RNA recognition motif 2 [Rosa chinensis]|uniref:Putative DAZ-associated protein 1, RNA recognition motif 2 n=1 Tax=Rosa chinensis TaxID=74649 RepID=A0A2P6QD35_ROSCH|nr:heterogeneous nuclear ribonucleoprotein 1 [Rosa chinensis]XP_024157020.1 heterogeneous nuclear ribonucleoprotein 1 [Rosa chinensis]PRQ32086.1 putative DAZ-associated protein 1, RNA recognition motif 2 [Rosa chinensis]